MWRALSVLLFGSNMGWAGEILPFDPEHPPLPEPGKQYRMILNPGKGSAPITLILSADDEIFGEQDGKKYSRIDSIFQEGYGALPFDNDGGIPDAEVADYDNDGYLDFRVVSGWGSGGSWYNYYRYDGKKYVSWKEPTDLGISQIKPSEEIASAFWRSGPCYAVRYYRINQGHFILYKTERYDQATYNRSKVPREISDNTYVRVEEMIEGNRIVHRTITAQGPGQDDSDAKVVFDQPVAETVEMAKDP